jgi:hypothetical protein
LQSCVNQNSSRPDNNNCGSDEAHDSTGYLPAIRAQAFDNLKSRTVTMAVREAAGNEYVTALF